jgi:hypothetical protein
MALLPSVKLAGAKTEQFNHDFILAPEYFR